MIKPLITGNNEKLLQVATDGNYQETKQLLEQGVDPNTPVLKRSTHLGDYMETHYPLLHAIENRHTAIVKLLVEHGADVNVAKKGDGRTPLHEAMRAIKYVIIGGHFDNVHASKADHELVKYLVEHGAHVNAEGGWCLTPFLLAIYDNDQEMVEYFLNNGADINLQLQNTDLNESRDTALGAAVQEKNKTMVQLLLKHGAKPTNKTIDEAFEIGNEEIITALLKSITNTDEKQNVYDTALIYAAEYGNLYMVAHLLENGANINAQKTWCLTTALIEASYNGHIETVKLLLDNGADVTISDKFGRTALARSNHYPDIVQLLLDKGAHKSRINTQDNYGNTALINAVQCNNLDLVALLLNHGADIDTKNNFGNTALALAAQKDNKEMITLLINFNMIKGNM